MKFEFFQLIFHGLKGARFLMVGNVGFWQKKVEDVPKQHVILLSDDDEAFDLAEAYIQHGVVGAGSRSDALHVAFS